MRLYYIVQSEILTGGVIEAQVVGALRAHREIGGQPPTKLIFLEPARVAVRRKTRETLRAFRGMWPRGDMAVVPYVGRLGREAPGKSLAAYLALERYRSSPVVFHCRGPEAVRSAHFARTRIGKGRVIFDMRGAAPYESIHRCGVRWLDELTPEAELAYRTSLEADREAAELADAIFTVSPGLRDYAVETLGVDPHKVLVVPSCVEDLAFEEESRRRARRDWGVVDTAPVLLYSGRLGPERRPKHMVRVFRHVLDARPDARLVLFAYLNELDGFGALLERERVPEASVIVERHSRDEALARSCGADVGVLFLEPALRYRGVQAPIKIAEYLSAGLSLLVNRAVGNIPELIESRGVGWVVDDGPEAPEVGPAVRAMVEELETSRVDLRRRSLEACSAEYLWRGYVPAIRHAYGLEANEGDE